MPYISTKNQMAANEVLRYMNPRQTNDHMTDRNSLVMGAEATGMEQNVDA
jgi:hypothetical protein